MPEDRDTHGAGRPKSATLPYASLDHLADDDAPKQSPSKNRYSMMNSIRGSTMGLGDGGDDPPPTVCSKWQAGKYIVYPHHSSFLPWWDLFIASLIVLTAFVVPYEVGYELLVPKEEREAMKSTRKFTNQVDLCFMFDILLQFTVSYYNHAQKRWVRKPVEIVLAYIHGNFFMDCISVLPYVRIACVLVKHFGETFWLAGVLSLLGLMRLFRVNRMMERYEARLNMSYSYVNMTKLMVLLCLTVHLAACSWGFVLSAERFFDLGHDDTWFDALCSAKPALFSDKHRPRSMELYTASLYWSTMTITSIGYGDVTPMNRIEAWACTTMMLIGGVIWAHIIGNVCAIASTLNAQREEYENQIDSLNIWMQKIQLKQDFRMELRSFFMVRRSMHNHEKQVELLKSMSPELQHKLARHLQSGWLTKIWFFQNIPDNGFMVGMLERFKIAIYPPRECVIIHESLCNLKEGLVLRGFHIHFPGDYWGVSELLLSNKHLIEDMQPVALSYIELQYLQRSALEDLCEHYPDQKRAIRRAAVWRALKLAMIKGVGAEWIQAPTKARSDRELLTMTLSSGQVINPGSLTVGFGKAKSSASLSAEEPVKEGESLATEAIQDLETRVATVEFSVSKALDMLKVVVDRSERIEAQLKAGQSYKAVPADLHRADKYRL
jgi:hypothetical protein